MVDPIFSYSISLQQVEDPAGSCGACPETYAIDLFHAFIIKTNNTFKNQGLTAKADKKTPETTEEYKMLYRAFGNTGEELSLLGFGCMRLPVLGGKSHQIDEEKATGLLHYAIDHGVNYVDTAYPYHSEILMQEGQSEVFLGKALGGGYRDKVQLATKLPSWMIKSRADMDSYLDKQLARLKTDHIDFYLLHSLNVHFWPHLKQLGVMEFLDSALADGRIRYAGFSFHDEVELFKEIVDAYNWSFCQIQYNFMDEKYQAGREGLEYAAAKGLGIVIMEPLRGGSLTARVPDTVQEVWGRADVKRSPAEWALRFVWNNPAVNVVLSGMNEMEHVIENIRIAGQAYPDSLTEKEKGLIEEARTIYLKRIKVNCTNCRYCMPCPNGVNIPGNFNLLNSASMYDALQSAKASYFFLKLGKSDAANCIECGVCEELCPQNIPIIDKLLEVKKTLGE